MAQKIAEALKSRGHDVFVVCGGDKDVLEEVNGVRVMRFHSRNIFDYKDLAKKPLWLRAIWHLIDQRGCRLPGRIVKGLKEEKPDLVLLHNLKGLGYQLPQHLKELGVRQILTVHDIQLCVPSGLMLVGHESDMMIDNPYNDLYSKKNIDLFSTVDAVVSPSSWLLNFYKERGLFLSQKTAVIRNPINTESRLALSEYNSTYLYLGQVEAFKGLFQLMEAFQKFQAENPAAKLLVAGDGADLETLKQKYGMNEWVKFLGRQPHDKISELFESSCCTIVPSLCYENSPSVVYESLAAGRPVIVAKVGGAAESVVAGKNGWVFDWQEQDSLFNALKRSEQTKNNWTELSQEAKKSIEGMDMDSYLSKILSLKP
jgi:glycosyltransferase involved in cell wall biosynthesis